MRILSLVLLFTLVGLLGIHTLTSVQQDIGRHLTLGKIIWETRHVPTTNLFSYTASNFPFINHHWLGEVLLYLGDRFVGLQGLIILKALLLLVAWGLAFAAGYRRKSFWPALVAGLISLLILIERTDVRPEILSFVFFAWYLFVLFRRSGTRLLWSLPLIQLLWVNTHIYFFMGPAVYALFLVQEYVEKKRLSQRMILVGAVILAANFLNPFTWRGALYPFMIFGNYGYSIVENQSPLFLRGFGYPPVTSIALGMGIAMMAVSFCLNYRNIKHNLFGLGLGIATAGLSLDMIRNFPLFALALMPVAGKNFSEFFPQHSDQPPTSPKPSSVIVAASLLIAFGLSIITSQFYREFGLGRTFGLNVPQGAQAAVDFIRAQHLKGPLFNNFDIGSYLIWKLPEEKVFIDGRPEAYPADFIQHVYIPMQEDPQLWKSYAEQYQIQYVIWNFQDITPWSQKFMASLAQDPNWPLVYRDGSVAIFVKNNPQHQGVIKETKRQ